MLLWVHQVIPDPPLPEWSAEERDIAGLLRALTARYDAAAARAAEVRERRGDVTPVFTSNVRWSDPALNRGYASS